MVTHKDVPPREPGRFRETDHFGDIFDDPLRYLTRDMVGEVIADGRDYPKEGGPGKMRRKKEYDGVDAVLVIAKDAPVLITGWTEVRDWAKALASDRWSFEDLERIRAFMDEEHKKSPGWQR